MARSDPAGKAKSEQTMDSRKLSGFLYKNAQMGLYTIPMLLSISKRQAFQRAAGQQYAFYRSFAKQTAKLPREKGHPPELSGKLRVAAMIRFNTLPHPRPATANLARMMAFGSLAGIIDIKRKISDYGDASEDVRTLAKQLFSRELKTSPPF